MKYDPDIHHRRSIRLKGYDYSQPGAYFVTMVMRYKECLFGDIHDGSLEINNVGKIIETAWRRIPSHFLTTRIDEYIVMPNHFHGILWILDRDCTGEASAGEGRQVNGVDVQILTWPITSNLDADASPQCPKGTQPGSLNAIIQNFKSISTRKINQVLKTPGNKIWQRDYFERIIRDERELNVILNTSMIIPSNGN